MEPCDLVRRDNGPGVPRRNIRDISVFLFVGKLRAETFGGTVENISSKLQRVNFPGSTRGVNLPAVWFRRSLGRQVENRVIRLVGIRSDHRQLLISTGNFIDRSSIEIRESALYRNRWTIETAFQEMAENLEGEIQTLGYPKAALFGFCMALASFNLMSVIRAAVGSRHGEQAAETFSMYYACNEVSQTSAGLS